MEVAKAHRSFHISPVVIIERIPGKRGDTGQPGESQVNYTIIFNISTNLPLV